jgi:hypothetical protein
VKKYFYLNMSLLGVLATFIVALLHWMIIFPFILRLRFLFILRKYDHDYLSSSLVWKIFSNIFDILTYLLVIFFLPFFTLWYGIYSNGWERVIEIGFLYYFSLFWFIVFMLCLPFFLISNKKNHWRSNS